MTLTELRKLRAAGRRRGQAKWTTRGLDGKEREEVHNDRLAGIVAYQVIPRLKRGKTTLVRWTLLTRSLGQWSEWVEITAE